MKSRYDLPPPIGPTGAMLKILHSAVFWCGASGIAIGALIGHLVTSTLGAAGRLDLVNGALTGVVGGAAAGVMIDARLRKHGFDPQRMLRWLRYGMRAVLLTLLLLAVPFGWAIHQARRQSVAVAALEAMGCNVGYIRSRTPTFQERLRILLGDKQPWEVDEVLACDLRFADEGLNYLDALPHLEKLDLSGSDVTDDGLGQLRRLKHVHVLSLARTPLSDAGLVHLRGLTRLNVLNLSDTKVTDAGLVHLQGLTRLIVLNLNKTNVCDSGLSSLRQMSHLASLVLSETPISDVGLAQLQGMTQLEELQLGGTAVTDAGMIYVRSLTRLSYLGLVGTRVTAAGLEQLRQPSPTFTIQRFAAMTDQP